MVRVLREIHGNEAIHVTASTGVAACNIGGTKFQFVAVHTYTILFRSNSALIFWDGTSRQKCSRSSSACKE